MPPSVLNDNAAASNILDVAAQITKSEDLLSFRRNCLEQLVLLLEVENAWLLGVNDTTDKIIALDQMNVAETIDLNIADHTIRNRFLSSNSQLSFLSGNDISDPQLREICPLYIQPLFGEHINDHLWIVSRSNGKIGKQTADFKLLASIITQHCKLLRKLQIASSQASSLNHSVNYHRSQNEKNERLIPDVLSRQIIGSSSAINQVRQQIARYANSDLNVLITGATGTGKELVARNLHVFSGRTKKDLIAENISAISSELMESALFGHDKGAFTGAVGKREGLFLLADKGTLFLDEIGDLSLENQAKLLRVIEEKSFRPVGKDKEIAVDFRLITATHQNLKQMVEDGTFRRDLYHRINQLNIQVPAIKDRLTDLNELVLHFLNQLQDLHSHQAKTVSDAFIERLSDYPFPGNIRELQNIVQRVFLYSDGPELSLPALENCLSGQQKSTQLENGAIPIFDRQQIKSLGLRGAEEIFTRELLSSVNEDCKGDRAKMAEVLKLPKRTLSDKLKRYGINGG